MRSLFLDAIEYKAEKPNKEAESLKDCLVVLVTFEVGDTEKQVNKLLKEVDKTACEFKTKKLMLGPFAHLSENLLKPKDAKILLKYAEDRLRDKYELLVSEFGAEKGLLLNIKPGLSNIRFCHFN